MIIYYFDLKCIAILPLKTDPSLVVDVDAVSTQLVASKYFKAIGRRDTQILECDGAIQHAQLAEGHLLNILR